MKELNNYFVTIHLGLRKGYSPIIYSIDEVYRICQIYTNKNPICVSVTGTIFIYKDGNEPGARIEFMQYPRFPRTEDEIHNSAEELGKILMYELKQYRFSLSDNYGIITYENEKLKE